MHLWELKPMSLTNTTGRLRYVAPLLLIVAVAACSKQVEAAPATTPAPATPAAPCARQ